MCLHSPRLAFFTNQHNAALLRQQKKVQLKLNEMKKVEEEAQDDLRAGKIVQIPFTSGTAKVYLTPTEDFVYTVPIEKKKRY